MFEPKPRAENDDLEQDAVKSHTVSDAKAATNPRYPKPHPITLNPKP